jgi:hypothetical protein
MMLQVEHLVVLAVVVGQVHLLLLLVVLELLVKVMRAALLQTLEVSKHLAVVVAQGLLAEMVYLVRHREVVVLV